ncbi:MAG: hypothetical protein QXV93_01170 [Zestosphaera sp.]
MQPRTSLSDEKNACFRLLSRIASLAYDYLEGHPTTNVEQS